jgi:hypothetical protein
MPAETLEDRLVVVENELARLKQALADNKPGNQSVWWDKIFGSFANSEGFEEAAQLGKDYREAQRSKGDGKAA